MCTFLKHVSCFNTGCQKEGQNEPHKLPKWSPKRPPGPPGRVKSRWEISPEAPRKITMNFFSAPGAFGSVLGASRGGSWSPVGAQEGPRGFQEPFWHHLGSQNGAPRPHFLSFFEHFGVLFWSPSPVAPLGLASMLISWPSLPSCFGSAVCFQKWGPPSGVHLSSFLSSSLACSWSLFVLCRLRSLHFETWKTSRPQAPSGRRGSRSD